jgi:spore germination cell wall hydrolase CwlJ-like protein
MILSLGHRMIRVALFAAGIFVFGAVSSSSEELLASRLGALLGQERQALDIVSSAHLAMLTAPPNKAQDRKEEISEHYTAEFLAQQPAPEGDAQWECLTEALYFEARGETIEGMFAVGEVILNRVESSSFPTTICKVVNQGTGQRFACQFTYTCDGKLETVHEPQSWDVAGRIARLLIDGMPSDLTRGATYYHATFANPSWAKRFAQTASIGSHLFYREPTRTASN